MSDELIDDGLVTTRIEPFPANDRDAIDDEGATSPADDLDCLCDDPELTMQLRAAKQGRKMILASLGASLLALAGAISLVLA